jgi:hypothetical protein
LKRSQLSLLSSNGGRDKLHRQKHNWMVTLRITLKKISTGEIGQNQSLK